MLWLVGSVSYIKCVHVLSVSVEIELKLEILQSLGGLYHGLAFYALHWSYAPSL